MRCIVCQSEWEPADGTQGPICDLCRDENPFAADRARMIEAAGPPTPEELDEMYGDDPATSLFVYGPGPR